MSLYVLLTSDAQPDACIVVCSVSANLPDFSNPYLSLSEVTGSHRDAGRSCLFQGIVAIAATNLTIYALEDKHVEGGCPEPSDRPSNESTSRPLSSAPSGDLKTTKAPKSNKKGSKKDNKQKKGGEKTKTPKNGKN